MRTWIRHAQVILPGGARATSIVVEDGKIADIDPIHVVVADETIDAGGLLLIPGVVDDQVHFRQPGLEHKEDLSHASAACAKGGVTSFLEMPNTVPNATDQARIDEKLRLASQFSRVNYGFYIGATPNNVSDLKSATRTPGIKIFIGSSTGDLLVDDQEALERIFAETTLPICAHCEDETTVRRNAERFAGSTDVADHSRVRDEAAAVIATKRALDLAKRHQHRFHVLHVSTAAEIPLIADHGNVITAEVCPHHLFFNVDDYARLGSRIKMNPSIKTREDNRGLWQALLDGVIQVIATDHAPHTLEEKALPHPKCPSGLPAVENSLALILDQASQGKCTYDQIVHWMCDAPARVWDMVGKGRIEVGYDADLVLVDPNLQRMILDEQQLTKTRWSPWHGQTLTGWPVRTWVLGQEVYRWEDGRERIGEEGSGREIRYEHERGGYWGTL